MILNSAEDIIYNGVHAQSVWYNGIEVWPVTHTSFTLNYIRSGSQISSDISAFSGNGMLFYARNNITGNLTMDFPYGANIAWRVKSPLFTDPYINGAPVTSISERTTASSTAVSYASRTYKFTMPKNDVAIESLTRTNPFIVSGSGVLPSDGFYRSQAICVVPVSINYVSARNAHTWDISAKALMSGYTKQYETSNSSLNRFIVTALKPSFYASGCSLFVSGCVSASATPAYSEYNHRRVSACYFNNPSYQSLNYKTAYAVNDGDANTAEINYTLNTTSVWNIPSGSAWSALSQFTLGHAISCSSNDTGSSNMHHEYIWSASGLIR